MPSVKHTGMALALGLSSLTLAQASNATLWVDVTEETIGTTSDWTNKVEVADLDSDGKPDLIFANGGAYSSAGTPEPITIFFNNGPGLPFTQIEDQLLNLPRLTRVIKAADVNNDGNLDLLIGGLWGTKSALFLGRGDRKFEFADGAIPDTIDNFGDLEFGDIEMDGDMDVVGVGWGDGNPAANSGGKLIVWINDGNGKFTVSQDAVPPVLIRWSWELEFVDFDGDSDLDVAVAAREAGSYLFLNDGAGRFADETERLPQFPNNFDFEAMDIDRDGDMDLATINDGVGLRSHILENDGNANFTDVTAKALADEDNLPVDDNMAVFADVDSDGDPDLLIGSLDGDDRLLINDGNGRFTLRTDIMDGPPTPGTLAVALIDLNADGRIDLINAQGEDAVSMSEHVYFGEDASVDLTPPHIAHETALWSDDGRLVVIADVHDWKSQTRPHDFLATILEFQNDAGVTSSAMLEWAGGFSWRGTANVGDEGQEFSWRICAADVAGNGTCSEWNDDRVPIATTEKKEPEVSEGCSCEIPLGGSPNGAGRSPLVSPKRLGFPVGLWVVAGLVCLVRYRRRRARAADLLGRPLSTFQDEGTGL